jgi:hypothetical protein
MQSRAGGWCWSGSGWVRRNIEECIGVRDEKGRAGEGEMVEG